MNRKAISYCLLTAIILCGTAVADNPIVNHNYTADPCRHCLSPPRNHPDFNPGKDLLSLHYDHAPDKDDGQSAAADRSMLQTLTSIDWLKNHTVAVSGAYGLNKDEFNKNSDAVMNAVWGDTGWIPAHEDRKAAVKKLTKRWLKTIENEGRIWVKEGGQSDLTADVVRALLKAKPQLNIKDTVLVVQHSDWNEEQTTPADLKYVRKKTTYIRIKDANRYLNIKGGDEAFVKAALAHHKFGKYWKAAFEYYPPPERLDFSDTGELLYILKQGEIPINQFQDRFLK